MTTTKSSPKIFIFCTSDATLKSSAADLSSTAAHHGLFQVRLGPIFQVLGLKAVFVQLAVGLLVANDDGPGIDFDDFALDPKVGNEYSIAIA
jgi:hypothetical protein